MAKEDNGELLFTVTYERMTPDDIDAGEISERGYWSPGGWETDDPQPLTLRQIVGEFKHRVSDSGGFWFSTNDDELDLFSGVRTRYSVHMPRTITRASFYRIARLLRATR